MHILLLISYICGINQTMENSISLRIIYKSDEFERFYENLTNVAKVKFDYVFNIIQTVYALPTKFVKRLVNTNLYEMRISIGSNEYRSILFAMDHENIIQASRILLLNGFLKKSEKDYQQQIDKAEKLLKEYGS